MSKKVPEVPASSLADIAFMLLIFFLVTTTMDVDSGLERRLPPMVEEQDPDTPPIKERNIFVVLVNSNNQLLVEGQLSRIEDIREKTKEFMNNPYNDANLPEKEVKEIDFFGPVEVCKGVISLRNDVGTSYGTYIAVQNELVGAINEAREELAKQKFGKSYDSLDKAQQKAVKEIYHFQISEAEPKRVGGK